MKRLLTFLILIICWYVPAQTYETPYHFPFQNVNEDYYGRWQLVESGENLYVFYSKVTQYLFKGTIYYRVSSNGGASWSSERLVLELPDMGGTINLSACVTNTGRIILIYSRKTGSPATITKVMYSDDNGFSWSPPVNIIGTLFIEYPFLSITPDDKVLISGSSTNHFFSSIDNGQTWTAKSTGFKLNTLTPINQNDYISFIINNNSIYSRKSSDAGTTWTPAEMVNELGFAPLYLVSLYDNGKLMLLYNLNLMSSSDGGTSWSSPEELIHYKGYDGSENLYTSNNEIYMNFASNRWYGTNQGWSYKIGVTQDSNTPPAVTSTFFESRYPNVYINVKVDGESPVTSMKVHFSVNEVTTDSVEMFNDGLHEDGAAGDSIWAINLGPFQPGDYISWFFTGNDEGDLFFKAKGDFVNNNLSFTSFRELKGGSLNNWYSPFGSEREEGFIARQQYGLSYPSEYQYQDIQASKGFWMGVINFTDEYNNFFPNKVVHSGPRTTGEGEFFPVSFYKKSRFEKPEIVLNGEVLSANNDIIDLIDPGMKADQEIYNELNTRLGVTVKRKISQFSHPMHDNYIVNEYTFVNTGNTDFDPVIELPQNNITGLQLFYIYRWAVNAQTRYIIGNASGWGINTMFDARGDGVIEDPAGENFRTIFGWHGYFPNKQVTYNNIGGPVWAWNATAQNYVSPDDTIGRLAAYQFPGVLTLHADQSAHNHTDDPGQPSSTIFLDSDNALLASNDQYNLAKMEQEYLMMSRGHDNPRHAWSVAPSGNFANQTGDPAKGLSGGFSAANSYGPYNLAFGDSIKLIWVEGVAGISREQAISTGKLYKQGAITDLEKNAVVLTGKDSLMKTWANALENFNSGFNLPQIPLPPKKFVVASQTDYIYMVWESFAGSGAVKYRIYRSMDVADSLFKMIYECPANIFSYSDYDLDSDKSYRYYITSVNETELESNKIYTLITTGVKVLSDVPDENNTPVEFGLTQNYPNPFNPGTIIKYSIPATSFVSLIVYDPLGKELLRLVDEEKITGRYEVTLNASDLPSGVYFYQLRAGSIVQTKKMILLK